LKAFTMRRDCHIARGTRRRPRAAPNAPTVFKPLASINSSGQPSLGHTRASMPRAVPTNSTSAAASRAFTSSAIATPGNRCPPVPPPAMSSFTS
jgi:hypothetical protein